MIDWYKIKTRQERLIVSDILEENDQLQDAMALRTYWPVLVVNNKTVLPYVVKPARLPGWDRRTGYLLFVVNNSYAFDIKETVYLYSGEMDSFHMLLLCQCLENIQTYQNQYVDSRIEVLVPDHLNMLAIHSKTFKEHRDAV